MRLIFAAVGCSILASRPLGAQQIPDSSFNPRVARPTFPRDSGPVIAVDAAHQNVHTIDGQFLGFARLATADGYRVQALDTPSSPDALQGVDLLVVASPRNPATLRSRRRPISLAYADSEVARVREWVRAGGSLLLIADHMPVPASMQNLLRSFGFDVMDGFATTKLDTSARAPIVYRRNDGTLRPNELTNGRSLAERIDSIATFTGSAFRPSAAFHTIWRLPKNTVVIVPDAPWEFNERTPREIGDDLAQGAYRTYGKGRVVLSAEAAMFTAQLEGTARDPMGMNHPAASQNPQFVLNILHWLTAAGTARTPNAAKIRKAAPSRGETRRVLRK